MAWPRAFKALAEQRIAGETGIGDTVERVVGKFDSDEFKVWFAEHFGVEKCTKGCAGWKAAWNARFTYPRADGGEQCVQPSAG